MKTITPAGNELIVSQPSFFTNQSRDPWWQHTQMEPQFGIFNTYSGKYVFTVEFALLSGGSWFYVIAGIGNDTHAEELRDRLYQFLIPPDGYRAIGEAYNYWLRPLTTEKVAFDDWGAWLAAR